MNFRIYRRSIPLLSLSSPSVFWPSALLYCNAVVWADFPCERYIVLNFTCESSPGSSSQQSWYEYTSRDTEPVGPAVEQVVDNEEYAQGGHLVRAGRVVKQGPHGLLRRLKPDQNVTIF